MLRHLLLLVLAAAGCADRDLLYDYDNDDHPDDVDCDATDPEVHPGAV